MRLLGEQIAIGLGERQDQPLQLVVGGVGSIGDIGQVPLRRLQPDIDHRIDQRGAGGEVAIDIGVGHARLFGDGDDREAPQARAGADVRWRPRGSASRSARASSWDDVAQSPGNGVFMGSGLALRAHRNDGGGLRAATHHVSTNPPLSPLAAASTRPCGSAR